MAASGGSPRISDSSSDEDLIACYRTCYRAQSNLEPGQRALAILLARYASNIEWLVRFYSERMCPDRLSATDFADDVRSRLNHKLLVRLGSEKQIRSLPGLLSRMVQTCAIDTHRFYANPDTDRITADDTIPAVEREDSGKDAEMARLIEKALERLGRRSDAGVRMATALRLHYLEGRTHEQVAEHLRPHGVRARAQSTKTIQRLIRQAEEELRTILEQEFGVAGLGE